MLSSSRIPGVAIANAWNRRLDPRAWPSVPAFTRRYSSIACCGSIEIVNSPGSSSTSRNCSRSASNSPWMRSWLASSTTIVRSPWRAASSPSAIATVDFPTPPLPVTNTRRLSRSAGTALENSGATSEDSARLLRILGRYEPRDRVRQPERWRRQDHDYAQPRSGVCRGRASGPVRRHGSPGQPDDVSGHRPGHAREVDVRRARAPHLDPRGDPEARGRRRLLVDRPGRRGDRDVDDDRPRALAAEGA